jgi:hypothetical protein
MQFYSEYTLGLRGLSNKKADKGSIVHKVLEIVALAKKAYQDGELMIMDDDIGEVETSNYDPEYLGNICARVYQDYIKGVSHHSWTERDFKDCVNWTWKTLKYNEGMFDPRNLNVVDAEPHFDFELPYDWAEYNYPEQGLKGQLALKGTIDLISDLGDGVYEIVDWKTGKRLDWATGKTKDQHKLFSDPQLRLYHYAAKQMYPHVHTFLVTIYFINDGGAFTVHFQDSDLEKTEDMIQRRFEAIRNTEKPKTIRQIDIKQSWKCSKLCHAGKTTFEEDDHVAALIEERPGKLTKYKQVMTKCEQLRYMIDKMGIDWVTENYAHPDHTHGSYGEGGGKVHDDSHKGEN